MGEEIRIRPAIQALVDRGNITPNEVIELRCNQWEWEAVIPKLNDQAFLARFEHALNNCSRTERRPFATYDESVKGMLAPELLRRFKALQARLSFPAPGTYAAKLRTAINRACDWLESAEDREDGDEEMRSPSAQEILRNAAHMTEDLCPKCGENMSYSYGEMMADSIVYCGGKHGNMQFSREADGSWTEILLRSNETTTICARWTHKQHGDTPPQTLTIGSNIFAHTNPRFEWFEPDLSDFAGLVEKIEKIAAERS